MTEGIYDVIVVGAGAAGLMAATRSAERGLRTLLLEKNRKAGVKILMSGGTRCNITHSCDSAGIVAAFGSAGPFLHSALAALGPHELVELFEAEGLATKVEANGKVFPQSDRAADVLDALLRRLRRSGAIVAFEEPVRGMSRLHENFEVLTDRRTLRCEKLIVTSGGKSYPGCGTIGDGYRWLAEMGHAIRQPRPALVPLTSDEPWIQELAGVTITDVKIGVVDAEISEESKPKRRRTGLPPGVRIERRGALLFTHFGLSGPAVLDVSRAVTVAKGANAVSLRVDFLPDTSLTALERQIEAAAAHEGKRSVAGLLNEHIPRRLASALLILSGVPGERRVAEFSASERTHVIARVKRCDISVTGSRGFEKAEVTAGGVELSEVDSRTMQSKLVPGLYLAGEILDLDGFIGGYNFQAAFSTGWLAGDYV